MISQLISCLTLQRSSKTLVHHVTFCNYKKIPLIQPIFIRNKLESDFKLKANYFNKFVASKCTPMNNDSSYLPSSFEFYSRFRLSFLNIIEYNILKIVRALNINKAHGHDEISVRMIKICDEELVKTLSLIYKNRIDTGIFLIYEKNEKLSWSIKGEINRLFIIIDPFLFCLSVVRSLNKFYFIQCM